MKYSANNLFAAVVVFSATLCGGCSSSKSQPVADGGNGGAAGSGGGVNSSGGSRVGSGGSIAGGTSAGATGGTQVGTGGATASGGSQAASGGATGTGGSPAANGGTASIGGSQAANGGTAGIGGSKAANGGTAGIGGSKVATGGVAGSGGSQLGNGGTAASGGSQAGTSSVAGSTGVPAGLLNPDYTTKWNPGILADTEMNQALGADGLPVRTTICHTTALSEAGSLQTILNGCAAGTVVQLLAGTYTVPSTLYIPSGVVLRGQGSSGSGATIIGLASGASGPVLAIGPTDIFDQTCYKNSNYTNSVADLTADALKEQNQISIAANNTTFAAGDFALVDQKDDTSIISVGDSNGSFARTQGRVLSQRVEIASVDSSKGTIALTSPLHWTFKTSQNAQIIKSNYPVTKWAGIEHLWVQGGKGLGEYLGRKAGGIDVSNAAYCWVKDVQTDGTLTGMHITLTGTNRCVVRDSHFHNSAQYGFGQDNYGIVMRCGAADNLVENNIARYMNKPILFNNSGGGNVVGYNYADNEWSLDSSSGDQFQESSIDVHCTFPHMELIEGNYAAHVGASTTHGNAGYLTYFRNYVSSQQAPNPIVWSLPSLAQTGNVMALQIDASDHHMTVIGNVLGSTTNAALGVPTSLGTADVSKVYMAYDDNGTPSIFSLGAKTDVSATTLWWHGNFDTVNGKVMWNSSVPTQTLPASLYYASKPAWWPSGAAWPWVGPDITPLVGTLQAQVTASTFNYSTSNNPSCTPNLANYSCP